MFKEYLRKVTLRENLSFDEAYEVNRFLLGGGATESEIAGMLVALKTKGETVEEIAGMAKGMKDLAVSFSDSFTNLIDNCGTGGDGSQSFNISTTSSFVLAGAGLNVAKHGNRSISSKSGSADVLKELGVNLNIEKNRIEEILKEIGIVFLFAPNMHPNMKNIMKVRVGLGIPTVFNILGPLTNPFNISNQLLGINRKELVTPMAEVLNKLGRRRAVVINGAGSMDEASLQGENYITIMEAGTIKEIVLDPRKLGFNPVSNEEIKGGDPVENAKITLAVLQGEAGPCRDTVILNSSLGIIAGGLADDFNEAIEIAKKSIDSGSAYKKLQQLIEESNK